MVSGENILGTGMIAAILDDGLKVKEYTIIVTGDVSGDGLLGYSDYVKVFNHIIKMKIRTKFS